MRLATPSRPYRGLRNTDPYGSGVYGASRGRNRRHAGLDVAALPGDEAIAPISGKIKRIGLAYVHNQCKPDLHSLHIQGTKEFSEARIKMLYLRPTVHVGAYVKQGQVVGVVEDVAAYHNAGGKMVNHIHLELTMRCDPQRMMRLPEATA